MQRSVTLYHNDWKRSLCRLTPVSPERCFQEVQNYEASQKSVNTFQRRRLEEHMFLHEGVYTTQQRIWYDDLDAP